MDFAFSFLILFPFFLWLGAWLWALLDVGSHPSESWHQAGESKGLWILVILVFQFFGTIIYFLTVRPKLVAYDSTLSEPHN